MSFELTTSLTPITNLPTNSTEVFTGAKSKQTITIVVSTVIVGSFLILLILTSCLIFVLRHRVTDFISTTESRKKINHVRNYDNKKNIQLSGNIIPVINSHTPATELNSREPVYDNVNDIV